MDIFRGVQGRDGIRRYGRTAKVVAWVLAVLASRVLALTLGVLTTVEPAAGSTTCSRHSLSPPDLVAVSADDGTWDGFQKRPRRVRSDVDACVQPPLAPQGNLAVFFCRGEASWPQFHQNEPIPRSPLSPRAPPDAILS